MSNEEKKEDIPAIPEKEEPKQDIPPELEKALEGVSPKDREAIKQILHVQSMMVSRGPLHSQLNPLYQKVTGAHIDKVLDYNHDDAKHDYELEKSSQLYKLIYVCLVIGFLIFMVTYLAKDNKDLLVDILKVLIAFGGGFGVGFGFKSRSEKRKK
ncbi:MAG: hypothetical protein HQK89_04285 [Nitrospirae bacterium]|nr:hypothetical protein [Nitrospirota bacterium]